MRLPTIFVVLLCLASIGTRPHGQELAQRPAETVAGDDGLPIPLDAEGVPLRRLSDAELFRLLLHLSRTMEAATALLIRCHALGLSHTTPGWRACIERN